MAEDYSEEEIERLQEELATVKRRFSHNKVKRKWVSEEGGGMGTRADTALSHGPPVVSRYLDRYCSMLADPCTHVCSCLFIER